ncbi:unnamed protein product [Durusdinium trenchii]|uniref:peptidylprolyl isomerase n=1 Tax=Durusdinium trenchii TaxID=1381693 RepID=A0ABP0P646_9DINO
MPRLPHRFLDHDLDSHTFMQVRHCSNVLPELLTRGQKQARAFLFGDVSNERAPGHLTSESSFFQKPSRAGLAYSWMSFPSGLSYKDEVLGAGEAATVGSTVSVNYTGRLLNGLVFDSSKYQHKPIQFELGIGKVIPGCLSR